MSIREDQEQLVTLTDLRERRYLIDLRWSAHESALAVNNKDWKQAYLDLASAADRLDAMQARCTNADEDKQ